MQSITFVLQPWGNPFSWWFLSWCLSQCILSSYKPVHVHKHTQALCLAHPRAMGHLHLLAFGWLCTFPLPCSWSHHCWPKGALGATSAWWCSCCAGRAELQFWSLWEVLHSPGVVFFFIVPAFALMCLLCCWRAQTFLLFYTLCFPSQTGTMDDFSQDLNCMSVPFSPENSELLWHSLKPYCTLVISHLLCMSLAFPGIPSVWGLLGAHPPQIKEAGLYHFAAIETSVCPSSPANLLFQTSD